MPALTVLIASLVIARMSVAAGVRLNLVDEPDARKRHRGTIPLTGGISVFLAIMFGVIVLGVAPLTWGMLVIAFALFLIGIFDDFRHIKPWLRLLIQYGAGICVASVGGIAIHNVGNLLAMGDIPLLVLTAPLTALAVAGLSNAYNMVDGIDGLSGSLILLPLVVLFVLATTEDHRHADFLLLMIIPLCVFLLFNLGPDNRLLPKMFLGDGGSITLGFLVTACLVYFSQGDNALIRPVTALWLVTVPLMDMLATMLLRLRNRERLMEADRRHLHYTLMRTGFSARQTLLVLLAFGFSMAMVGLALEAVPPYLSLACYFLLFIAHCFLAMRLDKTTPDEDQSKIYE